MTKHANVKRAMLPLAAVLVLMVGVLIYALPTNTQFELEGNATVEGPGDDWANTIPSPPGPTSEALASTFVADGSGNATIFTGGGSKDTLDMSGWKWKDQAGGLPDKDNITNAYAAAYANGNDLTLYFGADRFANDGDAHIAFWFFKQQVNLNATLGTFVNSTGGPATHTVGDILVVVNMSNGGAVATALAFRWVGGSNPLFPIATEINSALCGSNSDPNLCVISNTNPVPSPWAYTPKSGVSGTFPTNSFMEGGINVNILGAGTGACFSSFLAETRSSTSTTATLKDFALGEFNTCDVDVSKACPSVTFDPQTGLLTYTSQVTVTNNGFGTIFDVTAVDTPSAPAAPQTFTLASLAQGASHTFTHTFTLVPGTTTPNPPSNTATVTAATSPGGAQVIDGGSATATCPSVSFDASLTITKACTADLEVQNNRIVAVVNIVGQVCNLPPAPGPGQPIPEAINNVVITDTPVFEGGQISVGALAVNQCKPYAAKHYPDALTLVNGTPSTQAEDQTFEDTAAVTGTGAVSNTSKTNTATATCPLCPPAAH